MYFFIITYINIVNHAENVKNLVAKEESESIYDMKKIKLLQINTIYGHKIKQIISM